MSRSRHISEIGRMSGRRFYPEIRFSLMPIGIPSLHLSGNIDLPRRIHESAVSDSEKDM